MRWSLFVVLMGLSMMAGAGDPVWIYGEGHQEYRGSRYITALGEGSTSEDARKNAFSRLAEQLRVSISSQSNIVKDYRSSNEQFQQSENVNIQIQTQVNLENLEGIKIVSRYHKPDNNTYYAFGVLDKVKNATDLSSKIEREMQQIRDNLAQAKDLVSGGKSSEGLRLLSTSSSMLEPLAGDIELHKLFGSSDANNLLRDSALQLLGAIDQYMASVFSQVQIRVTNGERKSGSPELGVEEPYQLSFSYAGDPLQRVPVKVGSDMGSAAVIDVDDSTSSNGSLLVRVRSFPYTGKPENKLKVKLDINDDLFVNKSPVAELVVLLSRKSEVTVQLKTRIKSPSHDYLDIVVNEGLSSILSEQNYNVISDDAGSSSGVDYVVEVRGSVADFPGFSGMQFTKINGVILIKSGKTKRTLKTIKIKSDATKAGALNSESASEKSAAMLSKIIRDDLLETLEKNLGR